MRAVITGETATRTTHDEADDDEGEGDFLFTTPSNGSCTLISGTK